MTTQLEPDVLSQLAHTFLSGAQVALSNADGAEGQGNESVDKSVRRKRQLERAPADIHDHGTTYPEIKMRKCTAKAEAGFVLAAQDSDLEAGLLPYELDEFLAIGSVAHRASRDDLRALHAELVGERRHSRERGERVLDGDFTQRAFLVEPCPQPRSRFHFVYDADDARGRDVGNRLPNRIRSDVDSGNADVSTGSLRGSSGAKRQMRIGGSGHTSK